MSFYQIKNKIIYRRYRMIYGNYSQLVALNDFYESMCLEEMNKRIKLEISYRCF